MSEGGRCVFQIAANMSDLDRPMTVREFETLFKCFDKLDAEWEERRKEVALQMAERAAAKEKAEKAKEEVKRERANVWKKWKEGATADFLMLFLKVHQGDHNHGMKIM